MKIKMDFVTNSSSTCYIFSSRVPIDISQINVKLRRWDCLKCLKTKEQAISAANEKGRCDWIDLARGPEFYHMTEKEYNTCIDLIKGGKYAIHVKINRNDEQSIDRIFNFIEERGGVLVLTEAH
jgi:hypothetical protein